ncbi:MAG: YdcF family protein [Burkholderiales bacterium]|nr:YdcF family protein [Burkholderiales bacterium]
MIYLHKILPFFASPLFWVILLVAYGLLRRRTLAGWLGLALLCALSLPVLSNALVGTLEQGAVRLAPGDVQQTDAAVVPGGMLVDVRGKDGIVREWDDPDRFWGGLELYRAGKAPLLVFFGARMPWSLGPQTEGDSLKQAAIAAGVPASDILVSGEVTNTAEEALALARLLPGDKRRITLVTSAFHMPRAAGLFRKAGFSVVEYPVDFRTTVEKRTALDFVPSADAFESSSAALRELLGRLYYRLRSAVSAPAQAIR